MKKKSKKHKNLKIKVHTPHKVLFIKGFLGKL